MGAAEEAVELVEPALQRAEFFVRAKMPLADERRLVARLLHGVGNRRLAERQAEHRARRLVDAARIELVSKTLLIATGEQPGPRGTADHAGDVAVGKANAVLGEAIDVRRRHILAALEAEVAVAEVVGHDDDDVWLRPVLDREKRQLRDRQLRQAAPDVR